MHEGCEHKELTGVTWCFARGVARGLKLWRAVVARLHEDLHGDLHVFTRNPPHPFRAAVGDPQLGGGVHMGEGFAHGCARLHGDLHEDLHVFTTEPPLPPPGQPLAILKGGGRLHNG